MTLSLTTRSGKGSPLTHGEVDQNWTDIQTEVNTVKSDLLGGFKNKIINGNFDFWQRANTASGVASGYRSADRWRSSVALDTIDVSRQSFTLGQTDVPNNPVYFMRHTVTTSSLSNSVSVISQRIENVSTFSNSTCILSFWAKADASKNIAVEFSQSFGTGGSPSSDVFSIAVTTLSLGTSWKKFTVTANIPSISGKTLGTDLNSYLQLAFWFSAGSDFNSRINSLGTQSGVFDIAQVQLEKGSEATDFEVRPLQVELALCQRYYEKTYSLETAPGTASANSGRLGGRAVGTGTTGFLSTWYYKVTKRAGPTVTVYSPITGTAGKIRDEDGAADIDGQAISGNQNSIIVASAAATTNGNFYAAHAIADAEL